MQRLTDFAVVVKACNLGGQPVGTSHGSCLYADEIVARAKALRDEGLSLRAIAALLGPHPVTVQRWVNGTSRKPAVRQIARRVRSE